MSAVVPFDALWKRVTAECAPKWMSVHGPDHWRRVERNALILATRTGANIDVVRLFALFHDSQRVNDGFDLEHGPRAAVYVRSLWRSAFELPDEAFEKLEYACEWHTTGLHHEDATIATCWDADRLDLGRVSIIPNEKFMSTAFGKEIARYGSLQPWAHLAPPIFGS
ncbi:hypothetical protein [Verrucomicrobium sp. BvORR106]|uniref:hypothetical protein n=1 Tax=Verrucomicrobium sp. BvORR106 TaxID=1403819 RepID=UPI00068C355A|nr:hypothetical protein [Verrucomicrobium sp. BvORR106]